MKSNAPINFSFLHPNILHKSLTQKCVTNKKIKNKNNLPRNDKKCDFANVAKHAQERKDRCQFMLMKSD